MSLPTDFSTPEDYFKECMKFLQDYKHLYNFPNTDILVHNVLDEINVENLENEDVFEENFDLPSNRDKNYFLKDIFSKMERLVVNYDDYREEEELENIINVPLSVKKKHEIVHLAREIAEICEEGNLDTVVDFGSGLGYLDQLIFETTNLKVLGLECNENHYIGAKKRQRKYHVESIENVKYIKHYISENSDTKIQEYLEDKFGNCNGFCITGLHACADLTIDAINLFLKMPEARAIVLMPCCYHKLRTDSCEDRFANFPMSECLKRLYEENNGFEYLRVPFLRLATQPPCRLEDNLRDSVFSLVSRAVLQLYAHRHHIKLKRNKRKAVRMKTVQNDFTNYIEDAVNGFTIVPSNEFYEKSGTGQQQFDLQELKEMWQEISNNGALIKAAIFILLQNLMQPIFENFVLFDRVVYLQEHNIPCRFKKIFNEAISPRCLALVAYK